MVAEKLPVWGYDGSRGDDDMTTNVYVAPLLELLLLLHTRYRPVVILVVFAAEIDFLEGCCDRLLLASCSLLLTILRLTFAFAIA